MLSDTLVAGLERYRIGPKIRSLRQKKKLELVQLGEHTGLSPALLSKIERGQLFPTLPTLLRIAMVFNVGLEHFFTDTSEPPTVTIVRKTERVRLPNDPGEEVPAYFFESLDYPVADRDVEIFYAEFQSPTKASQPHRHTGSEFIYILRGELIVAVDDEEYVLSAGDAMNFNSGFPHSYRAGKRAGCAALVVVVPQGNARRGPERPVSPEA